ncbi:formiminoglutamase (plasmid) [Haloterrigena turkmenica DSM 5511]|uniref:Formimidoylglutamase n=1 Tax=Haloterrigena turkmenica (strain ATCC 51198 / DSM 5511 / JCM 9101 / NCIMB 13204 / VKM B-1734 / 4k) TaxID=543526 RepID=D2S0I5_HALTV|nr:formimidoylglutamase [Haloterrigena turkmenica]ADB62882.1 formiminoglutamase [Haloterrigena turkmenica DSM 5511]
MSSFTTPLNWSGPSSDPLDEQFGDVVSGTDLDTADEFDAVLVGEPYDGAVISRRGAAEGPEALRNALAGVKTHHFDTGAINSVADLGDIDVPTGSVTEVQDEVQEVTRSVHALDTLPIFLGGDNSLTVPNVAPLLEDSSVGVLNIDAHLDVRTVRDGPTSGTPYRQLHEAGLDSYTCLGARHFETSTAYHDYVRENGGTVVTADEVAADLSEAVDRALSSLGTVDRIYCSVDIDVLDASYCGSSAPTPGGLLPRELFRLMRLVSDDERLAGFELVECAPPLDTDGRTVDAAARTVAHFLSGWSA